MNYKIVNIKKPLYETKEYDCVCVYDRYVNDAIRDKQFLLVKSKNGEGMFEPKWIRKNCSVIEKVFLRKDQPMKLFQLFVPKRKQKTKDEELKELCQLVHL